MLFGDNCPISKIRDWVILIIPQYYTDRSRRSYRERACDVQSVPVIEIVEEETTKQAESLNCPEITVEEHHDENDHCIQSLTVTTDKDNPNSLEAINDSDVLAPTPEIVIEITGPGSSNESSNGGSGCITPEALESKLAIVITGSDEDEITSNSTPEMDTQSIDSSLKGDLSVYKESEDKDHDHDSGILC